MKKYKYIFKDALILLVVSTVFVTICNQFFKMLKKGSNADPLVTAILQDNAGEAGEILSEKGFGASKESFESLEAYLNDRVSRADEFGRTSLMWAAYSNFNDPKRISETDAKRLGIVDMLLTSGADINARDKDGWTPLMWASWSGLTGVSQKLIDSGASLSECDRQGNTALMMAVMRANADIVKLLTANSADKTVENKRGMRALDMAAEGLQNHPGKASLYREIMSLLGT